MAVPVKALLYKEWNNKPVEIRRFRIDQDVNTSYAYLVQKIAKVFPSVKADKLAVTWIDGDGDRISISSDAELIEAMDQFEGTVFRIQIRDTSTAVSTPDPCVDKLAGGSHSLGVLHPRVVCDGCGGPIYGIRYKCQACPDYDLCTTCRGKGGHAEHKMAALGTPQTVHPSSGYPRPPAGSEMGRGPYDSSQVPSYTAKPTPSSGSGVGMTSKPIDGSSGKCKGSFDQERGFLYTIGETIASFLEPFGVKVDVDVVDKKSSPEGTGDSGVPPGGGGATNTQAAEDDQIQIAVAQLRSMGYEDDEGWLTELVKAKKGDVDRVLEALHPSQ